MTSADKQQKCFEYERKLLYLMPPLQLQSPLPCPVLLVGMDCMSLLVLGQSFL